MEATKRLLNTLLQIGLVLLFIVLIIETSLFLYTTKLLAESEARKKVYDGLASFLSFIPFFLFFIFLIFLGSANEEKKKDLGKEKEAKDPEEEKKP